MAQVAHWVARVMPSGAGLADNNSLERTQPQRDFMYDVALLRRSARSRWAAVPKRTAPNRATCVEFHETL